jgi:hypothetical protein
MKTIVTKRMATASLMAIMFSMGMFAQSGSYTKEIKKEFPVNQNTRLEISNKYGNVDVVNRTDQALSIRVNIKVNIKDKERADALLNMIDIQINQEGDVVRAVTEIDDNFGRMFKGFNMGNDGLEINYSVSMPKTLPLNLSNK